MLAVGCVVRERVTVEARSWLGARFAHRESIRPTPQKNGKCDCVGLVLGVARSCNFHIGGMSADDFSELRYGRFTRFERIKDWLLCNGISLGIASTATPGDIGVFDVPGGLAHLAILVDAIGGVGMVHAYFPANRVVEHRLDCFWSSRLRFVCSFDEII